MYRRHNSDIRRCFFKSSNDFYRQSLVAKLPLMVHLFWGHELSNMNYQTLQPYQEHETRA